MTEAQPRLAIATVFFASLALLMIGITAAPIMFDEPSYVGAARNFMAGTPSVNPEHPPFAKYLIALSIRLLGDRPLGWRFPSALAGAGLAMAAFGLSFTLTRSLRTASVAWLLMLVNGFWYVMSRVAMLPIYETAMEVAAVWVFTVAFQKKKTLLYGCSGALFGLSIACRWSGVLGLAVCSAYAVWYSRPCLRNLVAMGGAATAVYAASWVPLLIREHRAASYFFFANRFIFEFHHHAKGDPRLGQAWWTWIVRLQPQAALSYLLGNPVIAVLGLAAVAFLLWEKKPLLPALYLMHVAQWATAIKPLTFYYYYFEAFTWLTIALAVAMQGLVLRRVRLDVVVTACAIAGFVHWHPM